MSAFGQDIRCAARMFSSSPGFAAAAVLSLAIGIGANTSIFSVVNALMLRPLPYKDPERLVILWNRSPGLNITQDWFSTAQYFDIRNGHAGFEQVAIAFGTDLNMTGKESPERIGAIRVSSNFLPTLGVEPALGRLFQPEEDLPGRPASVVLTHGMWARRFGSDPDAIGKSLTLNGLVFSVVGVLPRSFSLPREVFPTLYGIEPMEVFLPLPLTPAAPRTRDREDFNILGKLRPGIALEEAQAEMDAITAALRQDHPDLYPPNGGLTFSVVPLLEQAVGDARRPLYVLLGSVGFVLLVACANIANLSLARAAARQKEIALRTAVGASRGRIVRQMLTESVMLALCGGAAGILLAAWSLDGIKFLGPESIPRLTEIRIDGRVFAFTLLISGFTGILFGLAPALRASRIDLIAALNEGGRDASGMNAVWGRGQGMRKLLVIAELALSVVLLIGAGLLIRSFARLQNVHPGFNPRDLLTFGLTMAGAKYGDSEAVVEACRRLWERLERLAGATASGGIAPLPLGPIYAWTPIVVEGREPPPGEKFVNADERVVAARYFQAMEIPLRAGRFFDERDGAATKPVVIVDDRMAREFWPDQDPIGRRIRRGGPDSGRPWLTVVGVVGRVKQESLDSDPRIAFYLPHAQFPVRSLSVVVRSAVDPASLMAVIKEEIRELDPELPLYRVQTMEKSVGRSLAPRHFSMLLLGIFAGIALLLAAVGIYGVMAYMVSQGTREIGIRLAMGATRRRILSRIIREGMALAILGVAI
ncbi:MAG: ABC transporter permease, partial [Acidobacteria bacterium]|nr:ABC transporter permease [Acidobacteriota bacterium]